VRVAEFGCGRWLRRAVITDFVNLADIEPVYFDRTYYVAPGGKECTKAYLLILSEFHSETISQHQRAGPLGGPGAGFGGFCQWSAIACPGDVTHTVLRLLTAVGRA
jgi:hypothetical protein